MKQLRILLGMVGIGAALAALSAPSRAADLAAAKDTYQTLCAKCHGATGAGDGEAAASFAVKPRAFNDCAQMAKVPDERLFNVIKNGGAGAGLSADMPAWNQAFGDDEIHALVAYVRTFCKK